MGRAVKDLTRPTHAHSQLRPNKAKLCLSCFSSQTVNKHPFHGLLSAMFFTFSLVIFLFKMALKHNVEVLSSAPGHKKAMMYLMEKACMFSRFIQAGVT